MGNGNLRADKLKKPFGTIGEKKLYFLGENFEYHNNRKF
jgi:hypothetical protein